MQADLRAYWRDCFKQIQGWTDSRLLEYLVLLGEIQHTRCVKGNIAEIGVFDGRFFLALAHLAAPHEKCVAIDVFEDQQYNIDRLPTSSLAWRDRRRPEFCGSPHVKNETLPIHRK
jgi:hypothetical protein